MRDFFLLEKVSLGEKKVVFSWLGETKSLQWGLF